MTAKFLNGKKLILAGIQEAAAPRGGEVAVSQAKHLPLGAHLNCSTERWFIFTILATQPISRKPPSNALTRTTCNGWCCRPEWVNRAHTNSGTQSTAPDEHALWYQYKMALGRSQLKVTVKWARPIYRPSRKVCSYSPHWSLKIQNAYYFYY